MRTNTTAPATTAKAAATPIAMRTNGSSVGGVVGGSAGGVVGGSVGGSVGGAAGGSVGDLY